MTYGCAEAVEDIDAYAIGALDRDEAPRLEQHLGGCAACRSLLDDAGDAAALLTMAIPLAAAPAALRAHVLASAQALRPRRRSRVLRWWPAAAAAIIVTGAGLAAWSGVTDYRVRQLESRNAKAGGDATAESEQLATVRTELGQMTNFSASLADTMQTQDRVLDIVSQPDALRTPLQGTDQAPNASGRYLWSRADAMGALVAVNLPPLEKSMAYQMWIVYADRWEPAGQFNVDENGAGRLIVKTSGAPESSAPLWFCVTAEPVAAMPNAAPRGPMVLRSN